MYANELWGGLPPEYGELKNMQSMYVHFHIIFMVFTIEFIILKCDDGNATRLILCWLLIQAIMAKSVVWIHT